MEISNKYWNEIVRSANKRNIQFVLTMEEVWKTYLKQDKKCSLTGIDLEFDSKGYKGNASLDRIDSYKPYVPHNIQWIFCPLNIMKHNHSDYYFKYLCSLVTNHQQLPNGMFRIRT